MRQEVASKSRIYFEGAANQGGNGGWLFVTNYGIEHRVHKINFDTTPILIPHDTVISFHKSGRNLIVITAQKQYKFVVNNVNQWLELLRACAETQNKL